MDSQAIDKGEKQPMAKNRIARRDFLVMSGLATVGTVLAACAPKVVEVT
ncbi:unnamed protein product, partial [marine sediment metagenome]